MPCISINELFLSHFLGRFMGGFAKLETRTQLNHARNLSSCHLAACVEIKCGKETHSTHSGRTDQWPWLGRCKRYQTLSLYSGFWMMSMLLQNEIYLIGFWANTNSPGLVQWKCRCCKASNVGFGAKISKRTSFPITLWVFCWHLMLIVTTGNVFPNKEAFYPYRGWYATNWGTHVCFSEG